MAIATVSPTLRSPANEAAPTARPSATAEEDAHSQADQSRLIDSSDIHGLTAVCTRAALMCDAVLPLQFQKTDRQSLTVFEL
jgi:hypothetical protein